MAKRGTEPLQRQQPKEKAGREAIKGLFPREGEEAVAIFNHSRAGALSEHGPSRVWPIRNGGDRPRSRSLLLGVKGEDCRGKWETTEAFEAGHKNAVIRAVPGNKQRPYGVRQPGGRVEGRSSSREGLMDREKAKGRSAATGVGS